MPQIIMPYTVHLDHTLRVTPLSTLFAKGDSAAHRFELTILRAGVQEDLAGCTVSGKFYRMADSTVVSVPGTVEDGKAVAVLGAACYDYIGRFALTIAIRKGEEETTVFYGDGYMHGHRADTAISGEYIIYDIDTLLEKIAEIEAATNAANAATTNANAATANANAATGKANTAADTANTAAINANMAKDAANAAAARLDGLTATATGLDAGSAPTVDVTQNEDGTRVLAFGIPRGATGATPNLTVNVATGDPGTQASVVQSGTAENPVLLLKIPKGDTGDIGALKINGKAPDSSGTVTLDAGDVGAATAEALSSLKNDLKMDLLWTNASEYTPFDGQSIALDTSKYNSLLVTIISGTGDGQRVSFLVNKKDSIPYLLFTGHYFQNAFFYRYRLITSLTDTNITFDDAKQNNEEPNNYVCVPYQIYGVK